METGVMGLINMMKNHNLTITSTMYSDAESVYRDVGEKPPPEMNPVILIFLKISHNCPLAVGMRSRLR